LKDYPEAVSVLADMKAAIAIAKRASAGVKDPELREIARQAIYQHAFAHPKRKPKRKK